MPRNVNPFAVCKAAGKRGRWPKKKVERCIRSVKKSSRLGHVTINERIQVSEALTAGTMKCMGYDGATQRACLKVIEYTRAQLRSRGFKPVSEG